MPSIDAEDVKRIRLAFIPSTCQVYILTRKLKRLPNLDLAHSHCSYLLLSHIVDASGSPYFKLLYVETTADTEKSIYSALIAR